VYEVTFSDIWLFGQLTNHNHKDIPFKIALLLGKEFQAFAPVRAVGYLLLRSDELLVALARCDFFSLILLSLFYNFFRPPT
jgi:hypothetical protein